jgi:hypothetical protein
VFNALSKTEKKEKLVQIFDYIGDKVHFSSSVKKFIGEQQNISDQFLTIIYSCILSAITA